METILFIAVSIYSIFLNFRIRDVEQELMEVSLDVHEYHIKNRNEIMDLQKDINRLIKVKKIEKPRRRSTKKRSQLPKA